MSNRGRLARFVAGVGGVALLLGLAVAGPAAAATPTPSPTPPGSAKIHKHCITVIDKYDPVKKKSPIVSQQCATGAAADAMVAPAYDTKLMTVYEDYGFNADDPYAAVDDLYGHYGTCDAQGYGFSSLDGPNYVVNGISSYELYGNCTAGEYYTGYNFEGEFSGLQVTQRLFYVGDDFNDNMNSMHIFQF